MNDELAVSLLRLLAAEDGIALHRATKRLGVSLSELRRVLALMGGDAAVGGVDLAELRDEGDRSRIWLTARGRALCAGA